MHGAGVVQPVGFARSIIGKSLLHVFKEGVHVFCKRSVLLTLRVGLRQLCGDVLKALFPLRLARAECHTAAAGVVVSSSALAHKVAVFRFLQHRQHLLAFGEAVLRKKQVGEFVVMRLFAFEKALL